MMDKSNNDDEDEHDGSSSRNRSPTGSESNLNRVCSGHQSDLHIISDPLTDGRGTRITDDTENDSDVNMELENQSLRSNNAHVCCLVIGPNKNNDKEMKRQEIDTPRRDANAMYCIQSLKARWDSIPAIKKRRIGLVAFVGTVAVLVIGLIATATKMKNKNMEIDQLTQEEHTMKETIKNMTQAIDIMREKNKNMTQEIDIMRETNENMTQTITNMIEKERLDKDLTDEEISLAARICEGHQYEKTACQGKNIALDQCHMNVLNCIVDDRQLPENVLSKGCQKYLGVSDILTTPTKSQPSMRRNFFDRFNALFNRWIESVGNISSVNCTALSNGFKKSIREMTLLFKCDYYQPFEDNILETSLKACEMLRDGKMTMAHMCLIHKNMNAFEESFQAFLPLVAGAADPELQSSLENCTAQNDKAFHDTYFASNKGSGKI